MKKVSLGNTGFDVSALCFGAMRLGTREDQQASYALLDRYVEAGGSFIDTANIYAHWFPGGQGGESENVLGAWMDERGNRDDLFIASKVGFPYPGGQGGLSPKQIKDECHTSLRRLGVDHIDLYYAHVDDRTTPLRESLRALDELVKEGKVRFVGASNYRAWRLERAHAVSKADNLAGFCCLQQRYTYLRPKPGASFAPQVAVNEDMVDYVRSRQGAFSLLAYSVLLSGAYTRLDRPIPDEYTGMDADARLATLRAVAADLGATPNQVVLAWMRQNDPPALPLIAASTAIQLQENLGALDITLSNDHLRQLNLAGV